MEERCRLGGAGEAGEGLRESQGVDSLQFRNQDDTGQTTDDQCQGDYQSWLLFLHVAPSLSIKALAP